ncbi:hypothetical protein [Lysinibacillus sp. LZ02]|uniref:hypothetical protein n=1 Tax=Lysinibacillus sp. LZ02 TaxID=3420668 RepID=UPI003D368342
MTLLVQGKPLILIPQLASKIGVYEALFLQQLHYLLTQRGTSVDGGTWYYHSSDQWLQHFPFLSKRTLSRITSSLEKQGLIRKRQDLNAYRTDRTLWYTIVYPNVEKLFQ